MNKRLCLAVIGPTASGKSELAVRLAKKFNGEIISADSRQIYRGMNIGSGKVEGQWHGPVFIYKDIPHYLIDEVNPKSQYSVARFQKKAKAVIEDIYKRGKLPIICGGTGHWVDALATGQILPEIKPDIKLRAELGLKSTIELYKKLQKLDPVRAKNIDKQNPRRLIRALEIVLSTGKPVPNIKTNPNYEMVWIGINPGLGILEQNIFKRLNARIKAGMMAEVAQLHDQGVSWKRLESFGLEYKYCAQLGQGKLSEPEMTTLLYTAIRQYAKRQLTWWKRNNQINWFVDSKSAFKWFQDFLRNEVNR